MQRALDETERRRNIQNRHNSTHGIVPKSISKGIHDITERIKPALETITTSLTDQDIPKDDLLRLIKDCESRMKAAARDMEFEKAALLRDQIIDMRRVLAE